MSNQPSSSSPADADAADQPQEKRKTAAVCAECGAAYAAEKWPDGKILLIGRRNGCRCGATEFEEIEDDDEYSPSRPNAE